MNKWTFTYLLVAIAQLAQAQTNIDKDWHLTVTDSANGKGVYGATIRTATKTAYITDGAGKVAIVKNTINRDDNIRISCIGYKTLLFSPKGKLPDTIRLAAAINTLKEVVINTQSKGTVLGNAEESHPGGYLAQPNEEIAEYIPNNEHVSGTIVSVEFGLLDGMKGINRPFKANLYAKRTHSIYPEDELIKDSIIVYNPKGLKKVSVDISKYNIQMPGNGLFVGFQTLDSGWYGNDKVYFIDRKRFRVPGIQGVWKDRMYRYDLELQEIPGVKYSLHRHIDGTWNWSKFEYGTDFAIGVTVSPQ